MAEFVAEGRKAVRSLDNLAGIRRIGLTQIRRYDAARVGHKT